MKITRNTTKETLKSYLGMNAAEVKKLDSNLYDRLNYASNQISKDEKSVTKKDLTDLAREVAKLLGNAEKLPSGNPLKLVPVAENSVKPTAKTSGKDQKKSSPKAQAQTQTQKPQEKAQQNMKSVEYAVSFPETLKVDNKEYTLNHKIKTIKDLRSVFEKGTEVMFAFYWTKKHLKQFEYAGGYFKNPGSFPQDLDTAVCLYASDYDTVVYALSTATESLYQIMPDDFEEVEGIRYCRGMEYQIYTA